MIGLRRFSSIRLWLPLFVAVALLARGLVPAGWMPVAGSGGVELALCDGGSGMTAATMAAMPGMDAMPTKPGGAPVEHHHRAPDHPCSFAAAAATVAAPVVVAAPIEPARHDPTLPPRLLARVGHGLAAPPPPPTGPPVFA